jgi:glutamate-1-semialdehyde aminotransferase
MAQAAVKFSSKIDPKVLKELRAFAKESGRSMAAILTEAVAQHLERARVRPAFTRSLDAVIDEHGELLTRLSR